MHNGTECLFSCAFSQPERLKSLLLRLLGLQKNRQETGPPESGHTVMGALEATPTVSFEWDAGPRLRARYQQWLLGDKLGPPSPYIERTLNVAIDKLLTDSQSSELIPRVPAILPQLLKDLRNPDATAQGLAQQIAKDVVLVGALLSEVNSSYYNPATPIRSLDKAVTLLGLQGLRILIARTAFRPLIQSDQGLLTSQLAPLVWAHSERTSIATSLLYTQQGHDSFNGFLVGMLLNVGLIACCRAIDRTGVTATLPGSAQFLNQLNEKASLLSAQIGQQWHFPEHVSEAVLAQDAAEHALEGLSLCLHQAQQLARMHQLCGSGVMERDECLFQISPYPTLNRCWVAMDALEQNGEESQQNVPR